MPQLCVAYDGGTCYVTANASLLGGSRIYHSGWLGMHGGLSQARCLCCDGRDCGLRLGMALV